MRWSCGKPVAPPAAAETRASVTVLLPAFTFTFLDIHRLPVPTASRDPHPLPGHSSPADSQSCVLCESGFPTDRGEMNLGPICASRITRVVERTAEMNVNYLPTIDPLGDENRGLEKSGHNPVITYERRWKSIDPQRIEFIVRFIAL